MQITEVKPKKTKVTMSDIAALAGVSRSAVSAVLNNRTKDIRVSEDTRNRIEKIEQQTAFRSNAFGKALASGKSNLIALIVQDITDSFVPQCIEAIEDVAEDLGYGVLLMTTRNADKSRQNNLMNFVTNKWVDGIVLMTECDTDQNTRVFLEQRKVPIVYLGHQPKDAFAHSGSTRVNGASIGYLGSRHLILKGHKHIACIGMTNWIKEGITNAADENAAESSNIEFEYWSCDYSSVAPMKEILDRWSKTSQRPTALFFNGDNLACDFINLAVRAGIKIPDDLALLGVNDLPEAEKAIYPLSTIRQPKYNQAEIACKLIFDMIEGKPPQQILLEPELIVRETT